MSMAKTVERYLNRNQFDYDIIVHSPSRFSMETAERARIPGDQLAKAVILKDESSYAMAVLPATHRIDLGTLRQQTHRDFGLATETEAQALFADCAQGAIPPLGHVYDLPMMVDDAMGQWDDVYFEAGDHTQLVHMKRPEFDRLTAASARQRFSRHHRPARPGSLALDRQREAIGHRNHADIDPIIL